MRGSERRLGWLLGFILVFEFVAYAAFGQGLYAPGTPHPDHSHELRGEHPAEGGYDPYAKAEDQRSWSCCHGTDCAPFYGTPKRGVSASGEPGYWFDKWFVTDAQLIKPQSIPAHIKGEHHLCIAKWTGVVRCGYIAAGF